MKIRTARLLRLGTRVAAVVAVTTLAASRAFAQDPAPRPAAPPLAPSPSTAGLDEDALLKGRYQIRLLEGVFENAVQHAAQVVNRRMQALAPDLVLLTGTARVRGFRLEGYGVFFDVDVPALRQGLTWTFRTLSQNNLRAEEALRTLRQVVENQRDPAARAQLEQALRLLELRSGALPRRDADPVRTVVVNGATAEASNASVAGAPAVPQVGPSPSPSPDAMPFIDDPGELYTNEVKHALLDAMLDHSTSMNLGPDDWITIGARDNGDLGGPADASDTVTMVLRLRGRDLIDFRADRISRDEVLRRVDVRTF